MGATITLEEKINGLTEIVQGIKNMDKGTVLAILDSRNTNYINAIKAKSIFVINDSETAIVYVKIKDGAVYHEFTIKASESFEEVFNNISTIEIYATDYYRAIIRG